MVPVREKPEEVSEEPTPLEHAAYAGEIMRIEALLRAGEDVHIRGDGLYEDLPRSA